MTARWRAVRGRLAQSWRSHVFAVPVGVALLAGALLAGVGWIAVHEASNTVLGNAQRRIGSNRDAAVRSLVLQSDDYKLAVATTAANSRVIDSLRAPSPAALAGVRDELSTLAHFQGSPAAAVFDTRGRMVAIYPTQPGLIGQDLSFRDWFKGAARTGRTYVSAAYRTIATGHPLVVGVAAPVLDGSRRVGYVLVVWQLSSVRLVAEGSLRDDGVTIAVTDQKGASLTNTLAVDDRGQPRPAKPSSTTRQALAGRSVSTVTGGMLEATGPVPGIGWTVTAAQPSSIALAPTRTFQHFLRRTVGVTLLLVMLLAFIAWRFALHRAGERVALRESEDRFRRVFDEGLSGKCLVNGEGDIIRVNAAMARLLACEAPHLIGQSLAGLFEVESDQQRIRELVRAGDGGLRAEMTLIDPAGGSLWVLVALSWMRERDGQRELLAQVEDITARRAAEQRLTEFALHDELTGLPNRRLLLERCELAFARARSGHSEGTSIAALFVDLDGFKSVNDAAGHDTGDQVLIAVANDLLATLRPTDTVARIGGDEFIVLLEHDDSLSQLRTIAERITATVRRRVGTDTAPLTLSASVGIARVDLAREPDVTPEQLLRRADAAMYRAKERGRDQHNVFDTDLPERTEARQVLMQAIRDGLRDDRIGLVFQPVVDVDSDIVVGAEALLRLSDAEGRILPTLPAVVAAGAAGLAEAVGDRVLHLALGAASTWPGHMSLAVNISARELTSRDLRRRVEKALQQHDFDPARLILEMTESSILRAGPTALAELEKLRQRGVKVAIDDFGTSHATLANLTVLPVDVLKVDRSFTAGLPHRRTHTAIVHGIVSMAYDLDIPCVIEGVETEAQLAAIHGMAVHAQGWIWGEPRGPEIIPVLNPLSLPRDDPDTP